MNFLESMGLVVKDEHESMCAVVKDTFLQFQRPIHVQVALIAPLIKMIYVDVAMDISNNYLCSLT